MPARRGVGFEVERFEWTEADRLEVVGRWYGLRGRRFLRPVLSIEVGEDRRRLVALLDHKPWPAVEDTPWVAAFAWNGERTGVGGAELEVGRNLVIDLPPPRLPRRRRAERSEAAPEPGWQAASEPSPAAGPPAPPGGAGPARPEPPASAQPAAAHAPASADSAAVEPPASGPHAPASAAAPPASALHAPASADSAAAPAAAAPGPGGAAAAPAPLDPAVEETADELEAELWRVRASLAAAREDAETADREAESRIAREREERERLGQASAAAESRLRDELEEIRRARDEAAGAQARLERDLQVARAEIDQLHTDFDSAAEEALTARDSARAESARKSEELAASQRRLEEAAAIHERQVQRLSGEVEVWQARFAEAQEGHKRLQGELAGTRRQLDAATAPDGEGAPPESEEARRGREALTAERDAATRERDEMVEQWNALVAERDGAVSERDDAVGARDAATGERDAAVGARDAAVTERDRLAAELEAANRRALVLEERLVTKGNGADTGPPEITTGRLSPLDGSRREPDPEPDAAAPDADASTTEADGTPGARLVRAVGETAERAAEQLARLTGGGRSAGGDAESAGGAGPATDTLEAPSGRGRMRSARVAQAAARRVTAPDAAGSRPAREPAAARRPAGTRERSATAVWAQRVIALVLMGILLAALAIIISSVA